MYLISCPMPLPLSPLPTCRYDFVPPVKYNYLNEEEAEERFERRNKTLNYFSIMLSKKIKEGEGEGDEGAGEGGTFKGLSAKGKRKIEADAGLVSLWCSAPPTKPPQCGCGQGSR